ncbi:MAG TPA: class I SAM-dependent methyltransferase [Bacillota bacterium]|nr:class I SAM-dependent methyltransferase [Bacillota bacterium]
MGFYESIAQYYDQIFPVGGEQLHFLSETAGRPPKRVLDVACGSGEYSLALAGRGYQVTAVDLDTAMIQQVREKARQAGIPVEAMQADMLNLTEQVASDFDLIFCIGNSLVHLDGLEPIKRFLAKVRQLLRTGGQAVFQIINYDRILSQQITALPTITNEQTGLRFERNYRWDSAAGKVLFHTILSVGSEKVENTIPLFPLESTDFAAALQGAGFGKVQWYGDFHEGKFDRELSTLQVVRAAEQ